MKSSEGARLFLVACVVMFTAVGVSPTIAQGPSPSPYLGAQERPIKALSPERRTGLEAGAGLGYAMAAELNGHAGPKHVLELAAELDLSAEQKTGIEGSFERMAAASRQLGAEIVEVEGELDRRFAHRHVDEAKLEELTARLGALEGKLRFTHLRAHLETDALLSAAQRVKYAELRGYDALQTGGHLGHGH